MLIYLYNLGNGVALEYFTLQKSKRNNHGCVVEFLYSVVALFLILLVCFNVTTVIVHRPQYA